MAIIEATYSPVQRATLHRRSPATFLPRGKECRIVYNGLMMNDRRKPDKIVIDKITGLDDPDVRDSRDLNPDRDGETPFDALYGGRTITLQGYVVAGNLNHMRRMFSDVKDAFDELVESPLTFLWGDWMDDFYDAEAINDYGFDEGSGTLGVALNGSGLASVDTSSKVIYISLPGDVSTEMVLNGGEAEIIVGFNSIFDDNQNAEPIPLQIPFTLPDPPTASLLVGPVFRRIGSDSHLRVVYDHLVESLILYSRVDGDDTPLDSISIALDNPGENYYIKARAEGTLITYSLWDQDPRQMGVVPLAESSYTLSGPLATLFPSIMPATKARYGLHWAPSNIADRIVLLDLMMRNPGDAQISCRKVSKIDGEEVQTRSDYRRDFLITLRASDPRFVSRTVESASIVPSGFSLIFPPTGGLTFPSDGSGLTFGTDLPEGAVNLGRSPAAMIVRFYGPMTKPVLREPNSGRSIGVEGDILANHYLEFDTALRTVVDDQGDDMYDMLTDETSWPELPRGQSPLILGADSVGAGGRIEIIYRHSSR